MRRRQTSRKAFALVAAALMAAVVAGCGGSGGSSSSGGTSSTQTAAATAGGKRVLPVPKNPITNMSTTPGLQVTKALVENNVSPDTGKAAPDHLEVVLKNTSSKPLDRLELYYKITDPKKGVSEGYFTKLDGVTIQPGASETVNFDDTGAKGHFPVNKFSLYYTDKNALVIDVTASSPSVKPATFTVKKDAGGAEAGVE